MIDWDLMGAIAVVTIAVGYLARRAWRSLRGGCNGCGKPSAPSPTLIPPEQLVLRRR